MDDFTNLDHYDQETIAKAKYVRDQIFERGLRPVRFMRSAKRFAEKDGPKLIAHEVRREFR